MLVQYYPTEEAEWIRAQTWNRGLEYHEWVLRIQLDADCPYSLSRIEDAKQWFELALSISTCLPQDAVMQKTVRAFVSPSSSVAEAYGLCVDARSLSVKQQSFLRTALLTRMLRWALSTATKS